MPRLITVLFFSAIHISAANEPIKIKLPISEMEINIEPLMHFKNLSIDQTIQQIQQAKVTLIPINPELPKGLLTKTLDLSAIKANPAVIHYYSESPTYAPVTIRDGGLSIVRAIFIAPYAGKTWEKTGDRPLRDEPLLLLTPYAPRPSLIHEFVHYLIWQTRDKKWIELKGGMKIERGDYYFRQGYDLGKRYFKALKEGESGPSVDEEGLKALEFYRITNPYRGEEIDVTYIMAVELPRWKVYEDTSFQVQQLEYGLRESDRLESFLDEERQILSALKRSESYSHKEAFQKRVNALDQSLNEIEQRIEGARKTQEAVLDRLRK